MKKRRRNPIDRPRARQQLTRLLHELENLNELLAEGRPVSERGQQEIERKIQRLMRAVEGGEVRAKDAADEVADINRALIEGSLGISESGVVRPIPTHRLDEQLPPAYEAAAEADDRFDTDLLAAIVNRADMQAHELGHHIRWDVPHWWNDESEFPVAGGRFWTQHGTCINCNDPITVTWPHNTIEGAAVEHECPARGRLTPTEERVERVEAILAHQPLVVDTPAARARRWQFASDEALVRDINALRTGPGEVTKTELEELVRGRRNLARVNLTSADLHAADFRQGAFSFASFDRAKLQLADFRQADLHSASFRNASAAGVDFSYANAGHADFADADLRNAIFIGTNLTDAYLKRTSLYGADLGLMEALQQPTLVDGWTAVREIDLWGVGALVGLRREFDQRTRFIFTKASVLTPPVDETGFDDQGLALEAAIERYWRG